MDPISATAVVGLLVRYARHLSGQVGESIDNAVNEQLSAVWKKVLGRFRSNPLADGALIRLQEQPDNANRQAAVADHLEEIMSADRGFVDELSQLMAMRPAGDSYVEVHARDAGPVAANGNVTISGARLAAGRDLTIGTASGAQDSSAAQGET
ncbi:hypothetical protein M6D93_05530 [Jatrophihabitans telluris]|uniref:Uncharacterized protein n=1 Tax=Jatrophihabitans telluris TaxID=2038343 RepID=A0ABY4R1X8_9ACTN|nr:hypothetical protein [Jatrophihabitans telluris]UQX89467.1 hypothetical protein M6D93_05530 [Jatrophihabitans telluris]